MRTKHIVLNQSTYQTFLNEIIKNGRLSVTKNCRSDGIEVELGATLDF